MPNLSFFSAQTFYSLLLLSNTKHISNCTKFFSGVEIKSKREIITQRKHRFGSGTWGQAVAEKRGCGMNAW